MTRNPIKTGLIGITIVGLTLSGCGQTDEVGQVEPVPFDSVDELFEAVHQRLGCPEDTSGDYAFEIGEGQELLTGRRCAESVVMAYADDESVIADVQEMISTAQGGSVPIVYNSTWFVADITNVAAGGPELAHPESRDLGMLASSFRASYSEL